jgi:hypothetical protein
LRSRRSTPGHMATHRSVLHRFAVRAIAMFLKENKGDIEVIQVFRGERPCLPGEGGG